MVPFVGPCRRRSTSHDREGMWGRSVQFEWRVGGVVTGPRCCVVSFVLLAARASMTGGLAYRCLFVAQPACWRYPLCKSWTSLSIDKSYKALACHLTRDLALNVSCFKILWPCLSMEQAHQKSFCGTRTGIVQAKLQKINGCRVHPRDNAAQTVEKRANGKLINVRGHVWRLWSVESSWKRGFKCGVACQAVVAVPAQLRTLRMSC